MMAKIRFWRLCRQRTYNADTLIGALNEILRSKMAHIYPIGSLVLASKGSKAHKKRTISHARGKAAEGKRAKVRKTSKLAGEKYTPEFLSNILSNMSDLVVVFDEDYTIRFLNEAAKKVYGDTIGKKCHKVIRNLDIPCHHMGISLSLIHI